MPSVALALCAVGLKPAFAQPAVPAADAAPPAAANDTPSTAAPVAPDAEAAAAKAKALELNRSGVKHFQKGEYAAGLSDFQASLRVFPTAGALTGAGSCMVKLQRYDEALDAFEIAINQFGPTLSERTKASALQQIDIMRTVTGGISVGGAEVGAMIVIDGRVRGEHPTSGPVNTLLGSHFVRVYKEGFGVFEKSVDVSKGDVTSVPVKLVPLEGTNVGRLKVEEVGGKKMQVVVDGIPVGVTPWEGPVSPGQHTVLLRPLPAPAPPPPQDDDVGCNIPRRSAAIAAVAASGVAAVAPSKSGGGTMPEEEVASVPVIVVVKPNQTAPVKAKAEPLNALLRIRPEPASANIFLDGVEIGRGGFEGRIKPGNHTIQVVAEGYSSEEQKITVAAGSEKFVDVALRKDIQSPVWVEPGHYMLEVSGGVVLAPALGGDIAAGCTEKCLQSVGSGARVALRGGYELGNGLGFGLTVGYLGLQQTTTGRATQLYPFVDGAQSTGAPSTGAVDDTVSLQDATVGAYASYRLGRRFPLRLGLAAGVAIGNLSDTRTGVFGSAGIGPVSQTGLVPWFFVEPEASAGVRINEHIGIGLNVSALILIAPQAPRWSEAMLINPHGNQFGRDATGELQVGQFKAESVTGSVIVALNPSLSARYDF